MVNCQHRLGDILISWTWSHRQLETELFSARDRVDLILGGFLRGSKRPADSKFRPHPIRPIVHGQFFEAR